MSVKLPTAASNRYTFASHSGAQHSAERVLLGATSLRVLFPAGSRKLVRAAADRTPASRAFTDSSLNHISHILPVVYPHPLTPLHKEHRKRVRDMRQIFFATGNQNKLKETVAILDSGHHLPFAIKSVNLDLPELQGEDTDIAKEKCRIAASKVEGAVMVEDTSLCFNAYKGLPGPYIKWFLGRIGHEGLNNMLAAYEDKSAYAQCIFAFTPGPGVEPEVFVGRTEGKIVPARGDAVFGWDPIFQPDGFDVTYSEMDKATKNTISHRFRALQKLRDYLMTLPEDG
ncbi:hypothetical protein WJX73_008079 [Symbiochloris irregularis]|uniref:Inosine triphosphate pyrophosphatase n=1 Tax=Symbiochloris irregularis TaxID=706552 RepID=A0AAW1PFI7_9CHLO